MRKGKILTISSILCCITLLSSTIAYATTSNTKLVTYESLETDLVAEKISHPENGLMESDGIINYDGTDVADRGQSYSWSSVGYGDYMYVGTCYAAMIQTLDSLAAQNGMDKELIYAMVDAAFNGTLYTRDLVNNPNNDTTRSVLLKINVKTYEVTVIQDSSKNTGGYRNAIEFNDKLYFSVASNNPYILEVNPNTDETKIVYTCENPNTPVNTFISTGIRGLAVVNDTLFASAIGKDGASIIASTNPSEGQSSFEVIATQEDLLDYPAYHYYDSIFGGSIWDMIGFNDKLYVTVVTGKKDLSTGVNNKTAFAMFCGEKNEETNKYDFHLVIGDENDGAKYPYGLGAERSGAANLAVYDDHLYIGGYNDPMIALPNVLFDLDFKDIYLDLSSPVNLYRMDKDENIEMVIGDSNELFPEATGNMGSGFNNNMNQYIWKMEEYNGQLFVGTFDICGLAYPLMQFTNGDILNMTTEEWKSQINYIKVFLDLLFNSNKENKNTKTIINELETLTNEQISDIESYLENDDLYNNSYDEELQEELTLLANELNDLSALINSNNSQEFLNNYEDLINLYNSIKDKLNEKLQAIIEKILNNDKLQNLQYFIKTCAYLSQGERGFDLFSTEDGVNFKTITRNGFGDPYNHGCRVFAKTNDGLCVGTANPFYGTQIWKLNSSSSNAEETPDNEDDNNTNETPDNENDNNTNNEEDNINILTNSNNNSTNTTNQNGASVSTGYNPIYPIILIITLGISSITLFITYKRKISKSK